MSSESARTDYKSTLCLPQTDFPMRANLNQREPEILARWKEIKLQERIAQKPPTRGDFVLHDGPPYANGHIHLGHALNKLLKDIVVRFQTMAGHRATYIPGFDCHGLPIEQKVLSELGPKRATKTATEIRRLCDAYARKWVAAQTEEFIRIGVGGEWDKPYLTLQPEVEAGILRALRDLVAGGYVYKGLKPVYWCADCQTALAEAEIEYENHTSPSIYVKFPVLKPETRPATADLVNPSVVIWTTTPWTLPANLAVSLHPDFKYVALRVKAAHQGGTRDEDWIVARDLVEAFTKDAGLTEFTVGKELTGPDLEKMELEHPVQPDRTSLVILGDHVTLEAGTGAVHTAPGHGMEDFIVGQKYGLPVVVPVDGAGRFTEEFSLMEGMKVWEANEPIIRYLDEKDILVQHRKYDHSYPHCWRCHNPIIYRATDQWFMRVDHDDLRKKALEQIDNGVQWIPTWGHDRIYNMMVARPDWCLSRQRVWGVPIPALICKDSGKTVLAPEVMDKVAEVVAKRGTDAWFEEPVETFLPDGFVSPYSGGRNFEKEMNILDVWFDSGATSIAVLEQRDGLRRPADLYLEGSDQHRGWFQTSLIVSMGARKSPPFKSVLTHGFVLDGKGEAMSKSRGNVIAPQEIIKKMGADVLRLWVASEDYRGDVKVSNEILDRVGEAYRRIRNTIRYFLGNLWDFDPAKDRVPHADLTDIDRWILHELNGLIRLSRKAYENYEYHKIYQRANEFCVVQVSSIYVDVLKDRMYCSGVKSPLRRAAQTAQYELADALLRLLAPILAFTCDEAYQYLDKQGASVHLLPFPEAREEWDQPKLAEEWSKLLEVRSDVLRALEEARKAPQPIGKSLEARVVLASGDAELMALLGRNADQLADLFITSQAELAAEPPAGQDAIVRLQGALVHVTVLPATGAKCERCWRVLPSVGADAELATLCDRCATVVRRHY
ncbi:MAG: isoleucine--tRNA ligase [Candidatus Sumerlaeaceae bacterium]|nr:isoleucine--tRNA ligase [Candidatus Sumerlaeaceae bacterium]